MGFLREIFDKNTLPSYIKIIMDKIVISHPEELEQTKKLIAEGGSDKLYIISDFDRTLTKAFVNGKNIPSLISILRDEHYLTPDYSQKANELFEKYHSLETDPNLSLEERKKAMREWWIKHFELLIQSGLNKKDLERAINSDNLQFREGFDEFVGFLHEHNIPLVIMSSSGLGVDAIAMYLDKHRKLFDNIYIISNAFEWDEKGNAVAVKQPIIHSLNKDETTLEQFPVFQVIKNRKNALLLGDSIDDVGMVSGFNHDNLIKIGFLNDKIEERIDIYQQIFDVIILNDGSLAFVNNLLKELVK